MKNIAQRMDDVGRLMLPAVITLIFFIFFMLPLGITGMADFPPNICLISIYYWSIFYPKTMPNWFLFGLGIVVDSLFGNPLGVSSLIFMLFRFLIMFQQRLLARETFIATWISFAMAAAGILILQWCILIVFHGKFLPLAPIFMQWLFTFGLYPLAHYGFNALYRYLPALPGRAIYPGRKIR